MARLGYRTQIFDTRTEVVTHDRAAAVGIVSHVADYAAAGPSIGYPELTAVVVMTADYKTDVRALLGVATPPFPFVGLMGGRRKIGRIFAQLREQGWRSRRSIGSTLRWVWISAATHLRRSR